MFGKINNMSCAAALLFMHAGADIQNPASLYLSGARLEWPASSPVARAIVKKIGR